MFLGQKIESCSTHLTIEMCQKKKKKTHERVVWNKNSNYIEQYIYSTELAKVLNVFIILKTM